MESWKKRRFISRVRSADIPPLRVDRPVFSARLAGSGRCRRPDKGTTSNNANRELKRSKICNIYFKAVDDVRNVRDALDNVWENVRHCSSASSQRPQINVIDIGMEKTYIYESNASSASGDHDIRSAMLLTMSQFHRPIYAIPDPESYGSPRTKDADCRTRRRRSRPAMESLQYKRTPESILISVRDSRTLNSYCRRATPTMCEYCEVLGPSSCQRCLRKLNRHIADDVNGASPTLESALTNIVAPKLARLMDGQSRKALSSRGQQVAFCLNPDQCVLPNVDVGRQKSMLINGRSD